MNAIVFPVEMTRGELYGPVAALKNPDKLREYSRWLVDRRVAVHHADRRDAVYIETQNIRDHLDQLPQSKRKEIMSHLELDVSNTPPLPFDDFNGYAIYAAERGALPLQADDERLYGPAMAVTTKEAASDHHDRLVERRLWISHISEEDAKIFEWRHIAEYAYKHDRGTQVLDLYGIAEAYRPKGRSPHSALQHNGAWA